MRIGAGSIGFDELIASVDGTARTLSLVNPDIPPGVVDAVESHFAPQNVTVRRVRAAGLPSNVAVLHDGERFLAASDIGDLHDAIDVTAGTVGGVETDQPAVLAHVEDTTFIDYDGDRLVLAAREIERRAYRRGRGTLHAGLQRLSVVETRQQVYRTLAATDLDVHVYGLPDGTVPEGLDVTVHASHSEEIARSWFVVYDAPGDDAGTAAEDRGCGLLAQEVVADSYRGFWTVRPDIVGHVIARIETRHLES